MPRIVPATAEHALAVARDIREADRQEIMAASGLSPGVACSLSLSDSELAWSALDDSNKPFLLWGVGHHLADVGSPWLLATDTIYQHRTFFLKHTRRYVAAMLEAFPVLINYVDARHNDSIRWLMWSGFKLDKAVNYGVQGRTFFRFSQVRNV